jgi:hypothetical protein
MIMKERRRSVRELWQKERQNYVKLNWLLWIKMDKEAYEPGMEALVEKQRIVHEAMAEEKRMGLKKKVHEIKAGEMPIKTSIERSPATTTNIGRIRKMMFPSDDEADESQKTDIVTCEFEIDIEMGEFEIAASSSKESADLWSGADRAMEIVKAGLASLESIDGAVSQVIRSLDGTDIRKDNIGIDGEEDWSSGCEELEAEWVHFGEKVSAASKIAMGTMFAYCIGCRDHTHKVNQCRDFFNMQVIQRHGIVKNFGACQG